MPDIFYRPPYRYRPECNWLSSHKGDVYSQAGQDGIIKKIFEIIKPESKFCVEFGGWDGQYLSNTCRLIREEEWSGVFAEANAAKCAEIKNNHPYDRVQALNQFITWEGPNTFDQTMERIGAPEVLDLVSIDVDGNDWHIWNAMSRYKPRLIVIEVNPTVPNDVYFVQDADVRVNHGNSMLAMIELGKQKGYSLICFNGLDGFFIRDDYYPLFNIEDNSIDAMINASCFHTLLFQGYDGTLLTAGYRKIHWHNMEFAYDQLQVFPPEQRVWGDAPAP